MFEKGDPEGFPDGNVHRGPYVKMQASKKLLDGERWDYRVPADGNPDVNSGDHEELPSRVQGFLDESVEEGEGVIDFPGEAVGAP
ncbi:hypothetical protein [Streptomyces mirabilis]|uniref:hypothetical protein n=1 Tax=Streptomyces mirabilis TaxID=68239 RepID=UPI0036DCFF55